MDKQTDKQTEDLEKVMMPNEESAHDSVSASESVPQDLAKKRRLIDLKHWTGVLIVGVIAAFVIFGLIKFSAYLRGRALENTTQQMEAPYLNDAIGGGTPEETFNMFLNALKKGDTELASKFFVLSRQDDWRETLEKLKQEDNLNTFIQDLEFYEGKWQLVSDEGDKKKYLYEVVTTQEEVIELPNGQKASFPPGTYQYQAVFSININNIWKISVI